MKTKFIVFYTENLTMRERLFLNEDEANSFSAAVNGSVCKIK